MACLRITTWEYVAAELADDYEIWLVDLPGCGDSDAPKPSAIEPDGYSPTAMGERVWQALRQCLADRRGAPPRPITLVGHSLGGTVVIRMMSAPELRVRYAARAAARGPRGVVGAVRSGHQRRPAQFLTLLGFKGWMVAWARRLGVLDAKVRELTKESYHVMEAPPSSSSDVYAHALVQGSHREAAKAMLRQAVPFGPKTRRPLWPEIDSLVADYANISSAGPHRLWHLG